MLEFKKLQHFIAVAEERHVGRAAMRLHISQPPLSRSIHQLEEALGVKLFERAPHGVDLTSEGEVFLKEARKIHQMIERACEMATQARKGNIGKLVIGYFGSVIFSLLPKLIADFKDAYPEVEISIYSMNKSEQIEALRDHRIHIGFLRYIADEPGITAKVIARESLYVALPDDHSLAGQTTISINQLAGEPFIIFPYAPRPSFADEVLKLFAERDITPNITQTAEAAVVCIALVSGGLGLSIVPESLCNLRIPGVCYRPLSPDKLKSELCCIYASDRRVPVLDAFLERVIHPKRLS